MYHALRRRKKVGQRQPIHLPRHRLYRSYNREISNRLAKLGVFSHVRTSLLIYRTMHKFHAMTVIGTKRYRRCVHCENDLQQIVIDGKRPCHVRSTRHLERSKEFVSRSRRRPLVSSFFSPPRLLCEVPTIFRASGMSRIIIATASERTEKKGTHRSIYALG